MSNVPLSSLPASRQCKELQRPRRNGTVLRPRECNGRLVRTLAPYLTRAGVSRLFCKIDFIYREYLELPIVF